MYPFPTYWEVNDCTCIQAEYLVYLVFMFIISYYYCFIVTCLDALPPETSSEEIYDDGNTYNTFQFTRTKT